MSNSTQKWLSDLTDLKGKSLWWWVEHNLIIPSALTLNGWEKQSVKSLMHTISFGVSCSVKIICSINIQYPANVLWYQTFTFGPSYSLQNARDKVEGIFDFDFRPTLVQTDLVWVLKASSIITEKIKIFSICRYLLWDCTAICTCRIIFPVILISILLHTLLSQIYCYWLGDNIFPAWLMAGSRSGQSVAGAQTER